MNRQTKRLMAKEEARKKSGAGGPRGPVRPAAAPAKRERTKPRQFVKEVIAELKKVAWPSRQEVVAYSIVVLVSSIIIAAMIFGMDFVFTRAVLALFGD
ncbi:MAG: preprotein translocase subunit SecE [Actinomycetota bacterium]|nr:preprotein translocase subunit SecE [Actinomycetota bacterium]